MHCQISARRTCNTCGFTMLISSRYNKLLSNDAKRNSKIDSMGPCNQHFKENVPVSQPHAQQRKDAPPPPLWFLVKKRLFSK